MQAIPRFDLAAVEKNPFFSTAVSGLGMRLPKMAFSSGPSQYTYSDESWTVTAVAKFVMYISIPLG